MDNPEYTFQVLEVFSKIKTKEIPRELEEYISYVARTGDPVFQWSLVKVLIKEKLLAVLNEFKENNPSLEIPPCPNVDPFNYETMKSTLLTRLDSFVYPPFTIQRICELLSAPRKEYNRIDKYMRAVEKNVLVVSACELSLKRGLDADGNESMMNGMLYDKVTDSMNMNNFSNNVFSTSHDANVDELHLAGGKLDVQESDAVQQILDESWSAETADGDDFKINEANTSASSISVSFDNALEFVTEKSTPEKADIDVDVDNEAKPIEQTSSSFGDNDSLLMESSLQNIIVDNATISYDDTLKPTSEEPSNVESTSECKEDVIFTFNQSQSQPAEDSSQDQALSSTSEPPLAEEKQSFDTTTSEPQPDPPQADTELDSSLIPTEPESFAETINKDVLTSELEDQYKSEEAATFEYEDFSSQPPKTDSTTLEYTFEPTPKAEFTEEMAPAASDSATSSSLDQQEEPTIDEPEPPKIAEPDQATESSEDPGNGKLDESLCAGDNEAQKTTSAGSADSKESESPAHGEPEAIVVEQTTEASSSDQFKDSSVPPEGNP